MEIASTTSPIVLNPKCVCYGRHDGDAWACAEEPWSRREDGYDHCPTCHPVEEDNESES